MKTFIPLFAILGLCFSNCVSLQHINAYSENSLSGIQHFKELGYGFEQDCLEKCQLKSAQKGEIDNQLNCNCSKFAQADSVNQAIYNILSAYFSGLAKLSDNHLANSNVTDLAERVKKMNWLDERHTNACADIANILLQATTNGFRRNKLETYIGRADTSIQILLKKLQSNLQTQLIKELNTKTLRMTTFYQDAVRDKNISDYQKVKIAEEYYKRLNQTEDKKNDILTYCTGLEYIADGHKKLFVSRAKLDAREAKDWLVQSASNISIIYSDFNKLRQ